MAPAVQHGQDSVQVRAPVLVCRRCRVRSAGVRMRVVQGTKPQVFPSVRPPGASAFVLTLWTNDPAVARRADAAGVDRIGLDLETYGKAERQPKQLATWISPHREDQLPALRAAMKS